MIRTIAILMILIFSNNLFAKGRSYSSGSSSSRPSSSSSGTRSYSSGSTSKPTTSSPKPAPTTSSSSNSSSGRSYSSGSSSSSSKPTPTTSSSSNSSSGRSYSSGSSSSSSSSSYSSKPTPPKFDSLAGKDQAKVESRRAYTQGQAQDKKIKTPAGKESVVKASSPEVQSVRTNLTQEKWVNRDTRITNTFHNYTIGTPTVYHYNDHYNTFFWLWLLDQNADERARWAYNHRSDMDDARYRDLLAKDAQLEQKIKLMEGKAKDPSYTPTSIDQDLMYTNDYVDNIYNPEPEPTSTGFGSFLFFFFTIACVCICVFVAYAVFFHRAY